MSGEGIEYLWGQAKMCHLKAPIASKKSKETFWKLVTEATDAGSGLNICQMCTCSKKTTVYMKLYKAVQDLSKEEGE